MLSSKQIEHEVGLKKNPKSISHLVTVRFLYIKDVKAVPVRKGPLSPGKPRGRLLLSPDTISTGLYLLSY